MPSARLERAAIDRSAGAGDEAPHSRPAPASWDACGRILAGALLLICLAKSDRWDGGTAGDPQPGRAGSSATAAVTRRSAP